MPTENEQKVFWHIYGVAFDISRSPARQKRSRRIFVFATTAQFLAIITLATLFYVAQGSDTVRAFDALCKHLPNALQTRLSLAESQSAFVRYEYLAYLVALFPVQIWAVTSLLRLYIAEALEDRDVHRLGWQHLFMALSFLALGCGLLYVALALPVNLRNSRSAAYLVNPVLLPAFLAALGPFFSLFTANFLALGIRLRNGFESWSPP